MLTTFHCVRLDTKGEWADADWQVPASDGVAQSEFLYWAGENSTLIAMRETARSFVAQIAPRIASNGKPASDWTRLTYATVQNFLGGIDTVRSVFQEAFSDRGDVREKLDSYLAYSLASTLVIGKETQ